MRPTVPALRGSRSSLLFAFCAALATTPVASSADGPADRPDGPLVKLLRGGKIPEQRRGAVIDMIGKRGSSADLDFLFERVIEPQGLSPANRLKALDALAEATQTRNLKPAGDIGRLSPLIEVKADPQARLKAVRLAGLWKGESLGAALASIAESPDTAPDLRSSALDALAAIGGKPGRDRIDALTAPGRPPAVRIRAVAALAKLDAEAASARAVEVLRDTGRGRDDLNPMFAALLNRRGGADKLAEALAAKPIPADAARLALRSVYELGRSDPSLVSALTKSAKIDAEVKPLQKPDMDALVADVAAKGDPARGELIFRRADLSCSKCHAIGGAGGGVGPDLSPVGASSPVDYLVNSIMLPDQAIKEEFQTLVVQTADGQVLQGVVADKDDKRVILKDATGALHTVPTSDIEDSKEGGSLMPKGLVNFMTRAEFVDLVRFLSELGKPGRYAIRGTPTVQRWRSLSPVPPALMGSVPDDTEFRARVLKADAAAWIPAYAMTSGDLPLDELTESAGGKVLYLQAEVEVSHGDKVTVSLNSAEGVTAWIDENRAETRGRPEFTAEMPAGRHKLTFRVDAEARNGLALRVEVLKPRGSSAEYAVVGGR